MATEEEDLLIRIDANIEGAKTTFNALVSAGNTAGAGVAKGIGAGTSAALQQVKKTSAELITGFEQIGQAIEATTAKLGGPIAEVSDVIFDIIQPTIEAASEMGALGASITITTGAMLASISVIQSIITNMRDMSDAALEARDRMKEAGQASRIPPDANIALNQYKNATADLNRELDRLTVILGSELADDMATLVSLFTDLVIWTVNEKDAISDLISQTARWMSLGFSDSLSAVWEIQKKLTLATVDSNETRNKSIITDKQMLEILGMTTTVNEDIIEDEKEKAKAIIDSKKAVDDYNKALEDGARASAEFAALEKQFFDQIKTDRETNLQEQFDTYTQFKFAELEIARETAEEEMQLLDDIQEKYEESRAATKQIMLDSALDIMNNFQSIFANLVTHHQELVTKFQGLADVTTAAAEEATGAEQDQLEKRAENYQILADEQRRRGQAAWVASQTLAISQATIQGAVATIGMAAQMTPFLGPAALPLALVLGATLTGTTIAQIATAPAPQFPTGLDPDHHVVGIQDGEGIASRRTMQDPEMKRLLQDKNRGRGGASRRSGADRFIVSVDKNTGKLSIEHKTPGKSGRRR